MRLATWNVNSVVARLPRLTGWLAEQKPDVLLLQETKIADDAFPRAALAELGYDCATHGLNRWNGVAIVSRVGIDDVARGLPGDAGYDGVEARAIGATCGGVRIWSVYVPNGREPHHDHYQYKLRWLGTLRDQVARELGAHARFSVGGDFNVAPTDDDVWDIKAFEGSTHVTAPEREAVAAIRDLGLVDVIPRPMKYDRPFTYWDYRAGMFHKNMGMRIDLMLLTPVLAGAVSDAWIDRDARKGTGPSDHAPVVVDLRAE